MIQINLLIDNGHGSNTYGKRSEVWPDGVQLMEYDFNRKLAKKIFDEASKYPELRPVLLVPELRDISLTTRCRRANAYGASRSVFISVHGNASSNKNAAGWEVHTSPGKTKADDLADCVWKAVDNAFNGGARQVNTKTSKLKMRADMSDGDYDWDSKFAVLTGTNMPAILTENGFFTNEAECHEMLKDEWQWKVAKATVQGVLDYKHKFMDK